MKKKLITIGLAIALVATLAFGALAAKNGDTGHPSAKATAAVGLELIDYSKSEPWTGILTNTIKTANDKDLFIDAALQCGLYTKTRVKSKGGVEDTAEAWARIEVRVIRDQDPDWDGTDLAYIAQPGKVVYCWRMQTLKAIFGGWGLNNATEEELELILETLSANSFNFIFVDLDPGVHTITVQARITSSPDTSGISEAKALVGAGSVTIEEVRMIKNEVIMMP